VDKEGVVEGLGELIIELGFIEPGSTTKRSAVVQAPPMNEWLASHGQSSLRQWQRSVIFYVNYLQKAI
jgi:hypothetical protein